LGVVIVLMCFSLCLRASVRANVFRDVFLTEAQRHGGEQE
jgi:hypothetical protein